MAAINEICKVASHTPSGPGYRMLVLDAPEISRMVKPGQFIHLKIPALEKTALRRPFSVFDAENGKLTVLYKIVGRGTEALATLGEGAEIEMMGPLGFGFPEECAGVPLLVGGGYGVAPLHFLARRMTAAGVKGIKLFVGGRTRADLLEVDRFREIGVEVFTATNDGSEGVQGFVTAPLDGELAKLRREGAQFELFTCGPDGLLKAVSDRAVSLGVPGWISVDRHMICGVGACFACIQKTVRGNSRCCIEGPVFRAEDLVW